MKALRLRDLLAAGPRTVSRYTGTVLAVHAVLMVVTGAAIAAIAVALANAFGHLPMWDDAVDGDVVAMIECIRYASTTFWAIGGIAFGALVLWQVATWFLVGGVLGVLAQEPEGRREVARAFGASGAAMFFAYLRLAIIQLPAYALVLFAFATGLTYVSTPVEQALTIPELLAPIALASLPGLVLLHFFWTVTDYVRVELALRGDSHDPGVVVTYLRTLAFVARHPVTLLHGLVGWVAWIGVTVAYAWIASGHAMYGTEGAITIFVARQCVALLRTAIRIGILGGQLALGRTRPRPLSAIDPGPGKRVVVA